VLTVFAGCGKKGADTPQSPQITPEEEPKANLYAGDSIPLEKYLIGLSVDYAEQLSTRAEPTLLRLVDCPEAVFVYAADYTNIIPQSPNSVDVFSINAGFDDIFRAWNLKEGNSYEDMEDLEEVIYELKKVDLWNKWRQEIGQNFALNLPLWINSQLGAEFLAATGLLSFSSVCHTHKDFSGTICLLLCYNIDEIPDARGIFVVFSETEFSDVLKVDVIATEGHANGDDELWKRAEQLLNVLEIEKKHYSFQEAQELIENQR
jgi:hypothetical protein